MYMLFKNNRPVSNKKFSTYEKCRQWARKLARKTDLPLNLNLETGVITKLTTDQSRIDWRTPALKHYNYAIRRV